MRMKLERRAASLLLAVACLFVLLAVGCGGGSSSASATPATSPTADIGSIGKGTESGLIKDTVMGDPTPMPIPDTIGDCQIRPQTECPGADLRGADLGAATVAGHPA